MTLPRSFPPPRLLPLAAAAFAAWGATSRAQEPAAPRSTLVNPLAAFEPAQLDGFLGRPLFSPTRRAPPPAPAEQPPAAEPVQEVEAPPDVRLVGIIQTPRDNVAQLTEGGNAQRLSVRVGDFLGDWAVAAIDGSSLTLQKGEQEKRLELFRNEERQARPGSSGAGAANAPSGDGAWTAEDINGFFGGSAND